MEFGNSPLGKKFEDGVLTLEKLVELLKEEASTNFQITEEDFGLVKRFFATWENEDFTPHQKRLEELDLYLDIPLLQGYFHPGYRSLKNLLTYECTQIPPSNFTFETLLEATYHGDLALIKFVIERSDREAISESSISSSILIYSTAARRGHLEIFKFLQDHITYPSGTNAITKAAIEGGHLDCIEHIMPLHIHSPPKLWSWVARSGHVHLVDYFHTRIAAYPNAFHIAAGFGHLNILKRLLNSGINANHLLQ
jgi:hypothetical protein